MKRKLLIKLTLAGIGLCLLVIVGSFFTDPPKMTEPDPAQLFNPNGNFTLTGLPPGKVHIRVQWLVDRRYHRITHEAQAGETGVRIILKKPEPKKPG